VGLLVGLPYDPRDPRLRLLGQIVEPGAPGGVREPTDRSVALGVGQQPLDLLLGLQLPDQVLHAGDDPLQGGRVP
jgi:hypothetical protein